MQQQPGKETDSQMAKASEQEQQVPPAEPSKQKAKQHKEIQIRTLDDNKLKELAEAVSANIEVLTFRLENKAIFDQQGIHFSTALRLFANKGAKKLRIYLTNNPVTHNTLEEICKNLKSFLPNLVHLVFQLDQTLVNDQGITYIFDMLKEIGQFLKVFEISLTESQVTEIGMSDLFQALKFLPLECDVFVGNENSETLTSLAKDFSKYQKFQGMLQRGQESGSDEDDEEDESDEDNGIKIRNLDEEESDEEIDNKKKKKKKEKKKNQTKKKKGVLRTTKQQNQFGQFPQFTPQMLAGLNPMVLQQMYSQMMQQQRVPMNKMMMNPFMWQQNQAMQNMMMRGMGQQQPRGQQQVPQGQKFPIPGFPAQQQQQQQQFTPQMMQQQSQAFSQLQKNLKEMQKNQTPGEQKKNEGEEKIVDKQESKKEDETQIKNEPQQQQQQQKPNPIDPNILKNMMQQQLQQQQQQQQFGMMKIPPPTSLPQQFPQPKQQVGDFQLILEKLRSQQALLQQQQQNQKPLQQEQSNIQKVPETIGKPVQAIPPGFKQKSMQQQQQQNSPPTQPQQQQTLQDSIQSYFKNQQQNQQETFPKENKPVNVAQDQQYSQFFNYFEKNEKFDNEKFNNQFQSLNFFQQLKDEKNKQTKQNED